MARIQDNYPPDSFRDKRGVVSYMFLIGRCVQHRVGSGVKSSPLRQHRVGAGVQASPQRWHHVSAGMKTSPLR